MGSTGTSTATIVPANGFNSAVTLAASGWPAGISAAFGTNPTTASSLVTISVGSAVTPGPYTLTVNGTSGTLSASTTIFLTVSASPSFTLSATPATANVGSTGTSTATIVPANGFNSAVTLAASGWPAGISAAFGTNPTTASSLVTISVAAAVTPGPYTLTVNGTSGTLNATATIALTVTATTAGGSSANYTGLDSTTLGAWRAKYGADGYNFPGGAFSFPSYASVTMTGASSYVWAQQTSDPRALQIPNTSTGWAACYYSDTFNINVNLKDGNTHQIALYLLDWDTTGRVESIKVTDAVSNAVLDQQTITGFHNGQYAVWNIKGNVNIKVTVTGGANAVVSGLFFGPTGVATGQPGFTLSATSATANTSASATSTITVNPSNGFNSPVTLATPAWPAGITGTFGTNPTTGASIVTITVAANVAAGPYSLTVTGSGAGLNASTTIPFTVTPATPSFNLGLSSGSLTTPVGSTASLTVNVLPSGGFSSPVTLSATGWPAGITGTFGTNPTTTSSVLTISVGPGVVAGPYSLLVSGTAGSSSASTTLALTVTSLCQGSCATFAGLDSATQGAWIGKYGTAGYMIANGASKTPTYAFPTITGGFTYTWSTLANDARALQNSAGSSVGIASAYTNYTGSSINVNVNGGNTGTHQVALYLLDWDTTTRSQTITVMDAITNAVLDTQTVSGFHNGVYAVWNVGGNVIIKVTPSAGNSPVVSGVFFN